MIPKAAQLQGNGLLAMLPSESARKVTDACELVSLAPGASLVDPEKSIEYVYFPTTAVLSVLSIMADRSSVETAVTGNEGMAPIAAFHDVPTSTEQVIAQVPGDVLRMPLPVFRRALHELPQFRNAVHRYSMALFTLAAQTSGCNRRHSVVQRCARWLLQTHDRVPGDDFHLTHLFLSQMLGVRRSSVTVAAEALRAAGAISYTRGSIQIVDRARLDSRSCECYAIIRSVYDRLLTGAQTSSPLEALTLSQGGQSLAHAGDGSVDRAPVASFAERPEQAMQEFSAQVRETERRSRQLREQMGAADTPTASRLNDELSIALEQLQVAEEELRVQMEALIDVRGAMEAQQAQWRSRVDDLPEAFIETDQDDTIVEVNRATEEMVGRARHSLIGKPLPTLIADAERSNFRRVITELRQLNGEVRWRGRLNTRSSDLVEASVSARRIPAAGAYRGSRWLLRRRPVDARAERQRSVTSS